MGDVHRTRRLIARPPAPWPMAHCRLSRSRALKSEKDLKLLLNVHSNISKDRRDKVAITVPVPILAVAV